MKRYDDETDFFSPTLHIFAIFKNGILICISRTTAIFAFLSLDDYFNLMCSQRNGLMSRDTILLQRQ